MVALNVFSLERRLGEEMFFVRWVRNFMMRRLMPFFARHPFLFFLAIFVYLVSPVDILPESLMGPFGYVDDVVLALVLLHFFKSFKRQEAEKSAQPQVVETTAEIQKET